MSNSNPLANLQGSKGTPFSDKNQPTPEQKAAGWAKKKIGKELAQAALTLIFKGASKSTLKKDIAKYFGVAASEITMEQMLLFRQIERAIQKGDTAAFKAVMERAYGMPPQELDVDNKNSGTINITRTVISKKV